MIRPLTIATCLLACGSGLYLYQEKHEVQLLDRTIERTVHDTAALRDQSRLLAAEWTMLNDPERLRQFSDTYLNLKTIAPTQFTSLADLDSRLPAVQPQAAPPVADNQEGVPVAAANAIPQSDPQDTPDQAASADPVRTDTPAAVATGDMPVPPIPAAPRTTAVASTSRAPDARFADARGADRAPTPRAGAAASQVRAVAVADVGSDQRASDQRTADARSVERSYEQRSYDQHQAEPRPAPRVVDARGDTRGDTRTDARMATTPAPRPIILAARRPAQAVAPLNPAPAPFRPPVQAAPAPYGGSLLGMARGSAPPVPSPTPVNAAYNPN
jgi:hypothetical protein